MKQPATMVLRSFLGFKNHLTVPHYGKDWPCYISHMPDGDKVKHDALCIYDRPGVKDGRLMRTGEVLESFGVQIKVRSDDYRKGWAKISDVAKEIDGVFRLGIDAGNYLYFVQGITRSQIIPLGIEDGPKRRYSFVFDCQFPVIEEGPYPEWGNASEELYDAIYHFQEVVNVDFPTYFGS